MKVHARHTAYDAALSDWEVVRDCVNGEGAVKRAGEKYLPAPDFATLDTKLENVKRYDAYKLRAVFYPVTGHTLTGYSGTVFAKDPTYKVPPALEPLVKDIDGSGTHLFQQAQTVFREVLALGRCGLLVDYPQTDAPTTRQQALDLAVRPTVSLYPAESILNWRVEAFNGVRKITLLVLREFSTIAKNEFEHEAVTNYRVLRLEPGVGYSVEVYQSKGSAEPALVTPKIFPKNGKGANWTVIPFVFIGAMNNDATIDSPPLLDLANVNIAHYRNSADFEDSVHVVGQPTPILTGLTQHWVDEILGKKIVLGSRGGIPLPVGGSATLLQAAPNTLCQAAMDAKEKQMVAIGARLVQQQAVQRTATEASIDASGNTSTLGMVAGNVSRAYTLALAWVADFAAVAAEGIAFELSRDYMRQLMDASLRAQLVSEWQAGAVSYTEMREGLRRTGVAFEDDEKVKAEADAGIDPLAQPPTA